MRRPVPAVMSVHFPDEKEAELVKRVAARRGMTPSAWLRWIALQAVKVAADVDGWDVAKMKRRVVELKDLEAVKPARAKLKLRVVQGGKR